MDELKAIGGDAGLSPDEIEAGAAALRRQRQAALNAAHAERLRRRRPLHVGLMVMAALIAYAGYTGWRMADRLSHVEGQRARVVTAVAAQRALTGPVSAIEQARVAERVGREQQRYNAAAEAYNRVAGGLMGRALGAVFDQPSAVPLADEARW